MSAKLTIKEICAYAEALKSCEATELTWADAKPYFVKYVRSTGHTLPVFDGYLDINDEALALDKAEAVTLVDLCYGNMLLPLCFSDDNRIAYEDGVYTLTQWARETGAASCPVGLVRLQNDVHPKEKLVYCFNFVTNVNLDPDAIDIFNFNLRVRQFGSKFHRMEVHDGMMWCYKNANDYCKECFASPSISDKTMREFCALANKKI